MRGYTLRLTDLLGRSTVFGFDASTLAIARHHVRGLLDDEADFRTLAEGLAYGRGVLAEFKRDGTKRWREVGLVKVDDHTGRTLSSLDEIKRANSAAGFHWFSPDTLRFFRCRLRDDWVHPLPGGALFVSSEQGPSGARLYSVRRAHVTGQVDTVGRFQEHATPSAARAAVRAEAARLAEEAVAVLSESDSLRNFRGKRGGHD